MAGVTGFLLTAGYLASVMAYFNQNAAAYCQRISESPVPMLSMVLMVAIIFLALVPNRGIENQEEVESA